MAAHTEPGHRLSRHPKTEWSFRDGTRISRWLRSLVYGDSRFAANSHLSPAGSTASPRRCVSKLMTTDYLLWPNSNPVPYACVLGNLTGFKDLYRLWAGQSFREKFPPDAEFSMSPDFPDNTILTDSLMNRYHLVVGSEKLKNFFEEKPVPLVECLPVAIRDHKGKIAAHYFVVNPLNAVD